MGFIRFAFTSVFAIFILFACGPGSPWFAANAQESQLTPPITTLAELGNAPYLGSADQACRILQGYDLDYMTCLSAMVACDGEDVAETYLEDGTVIVTLWTSKVTREHGATSTVFRPVYPVGHPAAGQPLPEDHPDRLARQCLLGETNILILNVCGNPTITKGSPPEVDLVEDELPPKPTSRTVKKCEWIEVPTGTVYVPGQRTSSTQIIAGNDRNSANNCQASMTLSNGSGQLSGVTESSDKKIWDCKYVEVTDDPIQ